MMGPAARARLRAATIMSLLVLLPASAGAGCGSTDSGHGASGGATTVRVAFDSFISGTLPWVASERGDFADNGIRPEFRTFSQGVQALDAVLTDQADFAIALDFAALTRASSDQLRLVSGQGAAVPGFYQLAARDGISDARDLAGKRIGVLTGTNQQYLTLRYLEIKNVDPDQVELVPVPTPFELTSGLKTGKLDAGWVFGEAVPAVEKMDGVKLIASDAEAKLNETIWIVASKRFLEREPDAAARFLRSLVPAAEWTTNNTSEAAKIVSGFNHAPVEALERGIAASKWTLTIDQGDLASLRGVMDFVRSSGIVEGVPTDVKELVAPAYLRKAEPSAVEASW
jgi:ABC-type nitrate/sulfonate/bicarbonate transport system substrate-binding protein